MRTASFSGEDIICFSHTPWHGPWKASQQIMSRLARSNRVLYVGPSRSLREAIGRLRKRGPRHPVFERITAQLSVYNEPAVYAKARETRPWSRLFNWITSRLRVAHIRRFAKRQGMHSPILWIFDPTMAFAVRAFRKKLLVYHVLDNYVEFFAREAAALRAAVATNEARMLAEADLVFTVSESLHRRSVMANAHSFLVPNGVDFDQFQAAIATSRLPSEMGPIPRPIIGYVGVIQPDLDFPLLERLSAECPDWSLVFVGPEELGHDRPRFQALITRPNVHYLGCKAVKDVPAYINGCNVCIMPTCMDKPTVPDCDSIKLYEYLACGKPIVSTDIPSVRKVGQFVRIARDGSEFVKYVKESVAEEASGQTQRKAIAREHSWQRRVELLSEAVRSRLSASKVSGSLGGPRLKEVDHHGDA